MNKMSVTDTSFDTPDEDVQNIDSEENARGPEQFKERSSTTQSSASSSTFDSAEEITDLELALALKKLHDKELRRIRQMVASLRECRKKLIEVLVEKKKMDMSHTKPKPPSQ